MNTRQVTTVLAILLLAACADQGGGGGSVPLTARPAEQMKGRWQSSCVEGQSTALIAKTDLGITSRSVMTIGDTNLSEVVSISSSSCEQKDIEITSSGNFPSPVNKHVGVLTVDIDSVRAKPMSEFGVRIMNLANWCGRNDWSLGNERDVTARVGQNGCLSSLRIELPYSVKGGVMQIDNSTARPGDHSAREQSGFILNRI